MLADDDTVDISGVGSYSFYRLIVHCSCYCTTSMYRLFFDAYCSCCERSNRKFKKYVKTRFSKKIKIKQLKTFLKRCSENKKRTAFFFKDHKVIFKRLKELWVDGRRYTRWTLVEERQQPRTSTLSGVN